MIGGLSMTELIIILGLALLLLGPDQLPQLARSLGKGLRELRKTTDDLKSQFEQEIARVDLEETPRMIAPVPSDKPADKAAAEKPKEPDKPALIPESDPAAARAAARRAAVDAQLKLVPPDGTVARKPDAPAEVAAPVAEEPKA
jgi:sec-independent protein translocase protein TatB